MGASVLLSEGDNTRSGRDELYQFRGLFYGALQLAAGGVDVAAPGAADVGGDAGGHDAFLEGGDSGLRGFVEGHVGAGVPDDEVDLAAHAADQGDEFVGVLERVVDAAEKDVFEGDPLAVAQGDGGEGFEEGGDVPFARDGHDGLADLIVGGVEADGSFGAEGFFGEVEDSGKDAGGADGHARLGNGHLGEEADGGDEVGVVEEGLTHAHEDQVDAGGVG